MELWKAMLWLAFVLVGLVAFLEIANVRFSSGQGVGIAIGVILFAVLTYWGSKKGYQIGQHLGEQRREDRD